MNNFLNLVIAVTMFTSFRDAQFDDYVEAKTSTINNETYGVLKMLRKGDHVKVKYFAARNVNGASVNDRYNNWAANKKVIALTSGTYMTACDANYAQPVGLCIDQGNIVSESLIQDRLDGLMIIYATGGIVATDIQIGDLTIASEGVQKKINIRNNMDRVFFRRWAQEQKATVFQSHLFVYKDVLKVKDVPTPKQERRFLAVCRLDNGDICHYILNLSTASTIYQSSVKAYNYLKNYEDVNQVVFMINLDTGCQNIFRVYDANGQENQIAIFRGNTSITAAANLLAYYYE